jgi:hypothetical protein
VTEAGRLEVPGQGGIESGIVPQGQAHQQARLAWREQPADGSTDERAERLGGPHERVGRGAQSAEGRRPNLRGDRPSGQGLREVGVLRNQDPTFEQDPVASYSERRPVSPQDPQGFVDRGGLTLPLDSPRVDHRRPPGDLGRRIGPKDTLYRDTLRSQAGQERAGHLVCVRASPPHGEEE